jgi:predicted helicase
MNTENQMSLFGGDEGRSNNLFSEATEMFSSKYGKPITADELYFYVYGVLHSEDYRSQFEADLQKSLPRVPYLKDFDGFSAIGKQLYELHRDYDKLTPYPLDIESNSERLEVSKMKFGKGQGKNTVDKSVVIVSANCKISGIPSEAHDYVLSSRTALEWVLERYQVKTDKASGIVNDPNDWCDEHDDPTYIVELIKKVTTVSVRTVELVDQLAR